MAEFSREPIELDWYEYVAVIISLFISAVMIFFIRTQPKNTSVLMHEMPLVPIAMSLVSSSISGMTLLAKPAEAYSQGTDFACFYITVNILLTILTQVVFFPVLSKLKSQSIYDYFELRFSRSIRVLVATSFVFFKIFYTSLQIIPPSMVINHFSGVPFKAAVCSIMSVTTFYTVHGGYSGVIWTDTFQGIIMFGSMILLSVISVMKIGGISHVISVALDTRRLHFPTISLDPTDRMPIWAYLISISGLSTITLNQSFYQRFKSLHSRKDRLIAIWFNLAGTIFFTCTSVTVGLSVFSYYYGCDPKSAKIVNSYMDVIVYWLNDVGQNVKGFRGAYIAGITCASISSISASINTSSGLICKELLAAKPTEVHVYFKSIACALGVISTILALTLSQTGSLIEITYSFATLDAIVTGLFILGVLVVPANNKGVLIGGTVSLMLSLFMVIGSRVSASMGMIQSYNSTEMRTDLCPFNVTHAEATAITSSQNQQAFYLFRLSPFCGGPASMIIVILTGYLASLLFPDMGNCTRHIDLYSPLVHEYIRRKNRDEQDLRAMNA